MSNMSYCRFQNTNMDLSDCAEAINNEEIINLSQAEQRAFLDLIAKCKEIAEQFEDFDEYELKEWLKEKQE